MSPNRNRPGEPGQEKSEEPGDKASNDTNLTKPSAFQNGIIVFALCIATFLAALDITIVTTALPTISRHFNSSAAYVWIGAAYTLADGASTPVWGKISDIWGRKPILLIAIVVFFLGSTLSATAVSMSMLIVGRAIQGTGGGGLLTLSNIVVADLFSMRERGKHYGFLGMTWAIASSAGPLLGGALSEDVTWRWCFYINLPITGVAFAIVAYFLRLQTPKTPLLAGLLAVDWAGCLTIIGATIMLLLGLNFGGVVFPWASATVICLIVFGIVTYGLFLIIEYYSQRPVIPFGVFNSLDRASPLVATIFHGFVLVIFTYFLPLYFQSVLGAGPLLSGVWLLPLAVSMALTAAATGGLIAATGKYVMLVRVGMALTALGAGLLIVLPFHRSWARITVFQIILGAGIGPNFQALLVALQSSVKVSDVATSTATLGFARNLATSMGLVFGEVVFQNSMSKKYDTLSGTLSPSLAGQLSGGSAASSVLTIQHLPFAEMTIAHEAYFSSLRDVWILGTGFAAAGFLSICFIKPHELNQEHTVVETGLAVEQHRDEVAVRERRNERSNV